MTGEMRSRSFVGGLLAWMRELGYHLVEPDDHLVELWHKDRKIAVYPQTVRVEQLRDDVNKDYVE